jgi:hypothetical protein
VEHWNPKISDGDRPTFIENKREERAVLQARVEIKQSDTKSFSATLYDLSVSGFRLNCFTKLLQHKPIYIKIPGLQLLNGKIRWMNDGEYGCMFCQPLNPYVFNHIVSLMKS